MEKHSAQPVYEVLKTLSIPFEYTAHEPVANMEDCKVIAEKLKAPFCKNLFLQNRQGSEFFLLLIDEEKRFRTAEVSKKINKARLSFGSAENLSELLGLSPGAISPMGLIHDTDHCVTLLADRSLLSLKRVCVHPCVNTQSLVLSVDDLLNRFFPYTGHKPTLIEITGEIPEETPQ